MFLRLPTFHAVLHPCSVDKATSFVAHPAGHFCGQCQRVVQDFSQSADPVAALAAARAASPDGRVCGSFGRAQVRRPAAPSLSGRLRWFVVALGLVVAQGLSAREAWAQVRKPVPHRAAAPHRKPAPVRQPKHMPEVLDDVPTEAIYMGGVESLEVMEEVVSIPDSTALYNSTSVYTYVEQMPEAPQGSGMAGLAALFQKNFRPSGFDLENASGRLFVEFVVTETGAVTDARILKGSGSSGLDAAALQTARGLTGLRPGRQNGRPVKVKIALPVSIKPQ